MKKKKLFSGTELKILATVLMVIDHFAAIVLQAYFNKTGQNQNAQIIVDAVRLIGRVSYPLFVFLTVEGFLHTKDVFKYMQTMLGFALFSEVPYDLAWFNTPFTLERQNVLFTLLGGIVCMYFIKKVEESEKVSDSMRFVYTVLIGAAGFMAGYLLKLDFYGMGILAIVLMYYFRKDRILQGLWGNAPLIALSTDQLFGLFAMIFISKYSGERGKLKWKYFFYIFYPVHLLILFGVVCLIKNN